MATLHLSEPHKRSTNETRYISEKLEKQGLSLPSSVGLTKNDLTEVIQKIKHPLSEQQ